MEFATQITLADAMKALLWRRVKRFAFLGAQTVVQMELARRLRNAHVTRDTRYLPRECASQYAAKVVKTVNALRPRCVNAKKDMRQRKTDASQSAQGVMVIGGLLNFRVIELC